MTETTYGWNPSMDTARFAIGHDTAGVAINEGMRTTDRPSAADWLVTTIGDYSKFAAFVLQGAGLSRQSSPNDPGACKPTKRWTRLGSDARAA